MRVDTPWHLYDDYTWNAVTWGFGTMYAIGTDNKLYVNLVDSEQGWIRISEHWWKDISFEGNWEKPPPQPSPPPPPPPGPKPPIWQCEWDCNHDSDTNDGCDCAAFCECGGSCYYYSGDCYAQKTGRGGCKEHCHYVPQNQQLGNSAGNVSTSL